MVDGQGVTAWSNAKTDDAAHAPASTPVPWLPALYTGEKKSLNDRPSRRRWAGHPSQIGRALPLLWSRDEPGIADIALLLWASAAREAYALATRARGGGADGEDGE